MEFKGLDDWVAIFAGGKQTDSAGTEHDGDALIDSALASFDVAKHEPPVVVGHPKTDAPAFAWVEALREGVVDGVRVLYARFKQVVPEFAAAAEQGRYKKISAAFYPEDGSLRHVGFLGAAPPAVKGLPGLTWEESKASISFEQNQADLAATGGGGDRSAIIDGGKAPQRKEEKMTFKDFMEMFKFWKQVEQDPDVALPVAMQALQDKGVDKATFSEEDVKKAREEAAAEAKKQAAAEFAEAQKQKRIDARKAEVKAFCDDMVKAGKLTPALVKYGVPEMLDAFAAADDVIEFSAAGEKATLFDRFKGLFETELPKLVNFGEFATRDKDVGDTGDAAAKLDVLTKKKMTEDKDLDYRGAFAQVQQEHPELVAEYRPH